MVHGRVRTSLALVAVSLACCARPPGRPSSAPSIAGDWRAGRGGLALDLTLRVSGTSVTGYAQLRNPLGRTSQWIVTGEYAPPAVSLNFVSHDRVLARFVGHLGEGDTIRGLLADLESPADSLVFFRLRSGY